MRIEEIDLTDLDHFTKGFPHQIFSFLRREAPVWFHPATRFTPGGEGFWVLSRHADIAAAALDDTTFSSETGGTRTGGGTLLEDLPTGFAAGVLLNMMDDPRHRRIRKIIMPRVSSRALAEMEKDLDERTTTILDAVAARGACDLVVDVATELPLQAIARLLGVPQEDRRQLFEWAEANLDYDDRNLGEASDKTRASAAAMFEYGGRLIEEKRRNPGDDIMSAAVHARIEGPDGTPGPLSDLELQMFFALLIAAGSETTRNSIAVGTMALIDHPDQWKALQADRSLLPTAVEELLRWASSTTYNRRTATRDVEVGGQKIRAGDKVTLWWPSANRDEAVFPDPFRFDIRRHPNPHLTFGYGGHLCLGANLARMEMRLLFDGLLERFDSLALDGPVEWTRSNKHTGVRHMPVRLNPRRG